MGAGNARRPSRCALCAADFWGVRGFRTKRIHGQIMPGVANVARATARPCRAPERRRPSIRDFP